jgi:uncharacterized protein YxeA
MKNILKLIPVVILAVLVCSSCKKTTTTTTANPNASQHNQDVQNTKSESDNSNTDINSAVTGTSGFGKNSATEAISICGATIDSSHMNASPNPYLLLTYDGTTVCPGPNRTKSGQVKIELVAGTHWTDVNAQLMVTYTNYKVTFLTLNNAFIEFNGTKYLTDVNGIGLGFLLGTTPAEIRERTYGMTVTFENGYTASWNDARLSTWSYAYATGVLSATVSADTTINGQTNVDSWGLTRWGTSFTTVMNSPWQSNSACGWWAPTSGQYTSTTTDFLVSASFGLNGSGASVSSGCATDFKLSWTINSPASSGSILLAYY